MSTFAGKAVLVTGAGTGIGYALCQAFASAGATVALNDIDSTLCQKAAQQINGTLGVARVHPYACDVADVEAVRTMCQRFVDTAGRLDIAIANAGITNYGAFLTYTPEAFDRLTSVNLRGSFFTAQAAARIMIETHIPGRIILLASVTGIQAHVNLGGYGITKAGIGMLAKSIALALNRLLIWSYTVSQAKQDESLVLDAPIQRPSGFGIKTPPNNLNRGNPNNGFIHWIICTKQSVSSCR